MAEEDATVTTSDETQTTDVVEDTQFSTIDGVEELPTEETTEVEASDKQEQSDDTEVATDDKTEEATEEAEEDTAEARKHHNQEMAQRRIAEREERKALRNAQVEFQKTVDPDDINSRLEAMENERFVEKVENNISNAKRDIQSSLELPVFKEDPELFQDFMRDTIDTFGVFHETLKEEDGSPAFLGFYNPKTGAPISLKDLSEREASRLDRVRTKEATTAKVKAQENEQKMRARSDVVGSGKNVSDDRDDTKLSATEYAEKHGLKSVQY